MTPCEGMDVYRIDEAVLTTLYSTYADAPARTTRVLRDDTVHQSVVAAGNPHLTIEDIRASIDALHKADLVKATRYYSGWYQVFALTSRGLLAGARLDGHDTQHLSYEALDVAAAAGDVNQVLSDVPTTVGNALLEEHQRAGYLTYRAEHGPPMRFVDLRVTPAGTRWLNEWR